jgi:hypothetical protein
VKIQSRGRSRRRVISGEAAQSILFYAVGYGAVDNRGMVDRDPGPDQSVLNVRRN